MVLTLNRFTCFTSTKVQILTAEELRARREHRLVSVYLLYWYKSTNIDAEAPSACAGTLADAVSVYLLYWYKSTNIDAEAPSACAGTLADAVDKAVRVIGNADGSVDRDSVQKHLLYYPKP